MSSSKLSTNPRHKLPKKTKTEEENGQEIILEDEEGEIEETPGIDTRISSHIYLKPVHSTGTLDKEVVLRRIRHCKRVKRAKSVMKALLGSPFVANGKASSASHIRWVDDAFAAP